MRKISDLSFVFIFLFAVTFATILMSTNIETVETDTITLSETSEQKILNQKFLQKHEWVINIIKQKRMKG